MSQAHSDKSFPCANTGSTATCEDCVNFLLEYLDGVLPEGQVRAFELHLAGCPDCRVYIDNYRKAAALTRAAGQPTPRLGDTAPAALVEAILKARKGL